MPERAEVQTYTDQLNEKFKGKTLTAVNIVGGKFATKNDTQLAAVKFPLHNIEFNAKGKFLYWTFDEDISFFISLAMTGAFGIKDKHSTLEFVFEDDEKIYFNDPRHFATFKAVVGKDKLTEKLATLGWDPLVEKEMPEKMLKLLKKRSHKTIAEVLLEQKIFAGVGNYIRSEAMYRAGILPTRLVSSLSDDKIKELTGHIVDVIDEAYKHGGATLATYKDMNGLEGTFYKKFKVYSKKTDPDGNPVIKIKAADGRSVFYVESIQV